jgi:ribonuclease BN (tRNA processing enzyme)
MKVTILGSGAPLSARATTGLLVTAPHCAPLLIDTCGGFELARQLKAAGFAFADVRNVIATHRHLDHIGGLAALFLAQQPLDVFASADTHAGIRGMFAAGFPEWQIHPAVRHHVVIPDEAREIGGFQVEFFAVEHRVPTLAVRVTANGSSLAFSADTRPCANLVASARNVNLFLCDACYAELDGARFIADARKEMHPTARQAGQLAATANAGFLVLTHLSRWVTPTNARQEASEEFTGRLAVAEDLASFDTGES